MFAQIKGVIEVTLSGFKSIGEFKSKRERDVAIGDMLRFYFLLKDCIDEGESLIVEAGSNPVAKIKAQASEQAAVTITRWDAVLRRQGIRLRALEGLLSGQNQLAILNPTLEAALNRAIGSKMSRTLSLHGIGAALFIRCMFPLNESNVDKAKLVAIMAGERSRGTLDLDRIRREITELREVLDKYREFVERLASDEEIIRLSKKARQSTQIPD